MELKPNSHSPSSLKKKKKRRRFLYILRSTPEFYYFQEYDWFLPIRKKLNYYFGVSSKARTSHWYFWTSEYR